ncbi:hypothetical protein [Micromonospora sp. U21]|uniref:hypothetical protein n=1 Tax=Micromonospora sp. U21 TaxID=2824899 RepID=UPI001B35BF38|nr:hypothetical protein [Micromonospora sp. U21]MBQ0902219.1 hypothetical protein [Micromonospora sp. U21]
MPSSCCAPKRTPRLWTLATGGDRLRLWPPTGFGAAVHNRYGPTEASILVTATGDLRRYTERAGRPRSVERSRAPC